MISEPERRTQEIFTALMWALSYPGRPQPLAGTALGRFESIAEALIDLETSYYTPDQELAQRLRFTGARAYPPETAQYQFYPIPTPSDLGCLGVAPVGTYAYPDEGATIVVGCMAGEGETVSLSGPGIPHSWGLQIAGLPSGFWHVREQAIRYPLGWDLFLVTADSVIGVPRSTIVEVH
jgi:alpha-D-ribose 1-methylphosphonate 5-triphosphate synthase subunit PhnH